MKKHHFIFLVPLCIAMLFGCKPKQVDIDDTLKQISEETFDKTSSRSYLKLQDGNLHVVEYTFYPTGKTAVRKEVNLLQTATYEGVQQEDFSYSWGEFKDGMYGRLLYLYSGKGNRTLTYLNDQLNDGQIVTDISEPRADMAANMVDGLTKGKWDGENPTYVLQQHWVDTTVYEYEVKGKKIVCDTIFKRMPRPNYFDTIGIDSCLYYTYEFINGASAKPAHLSTHFLANTVVPRDSIVPQHQDPSQNDTIVLYAIQPGSKVSRGTVDYSSWAITNIAVVKGSQSMDITLGQGEAGESTLSVTDYLFDGTEGSFTLDGKTFLFTPKN